MTCEQKVYTQAQVLTHMLEILRVTIITKRRVRLFRRKTIFPIFKCLGLPKNMSQPKKLVNLLRQQRKDDKPYGAIGESPGFVLPWHTRGIASSCLDQTYFLFKPLSSQS